MFIYGLLVGILLSSALGRPSSVHQQPKSSDAVESSTLAELAALEEAESLEAAAEEELERARAMRKR